MGIETEGKLRLNYTSNIANRLHQLGFGLKHQEKDLKSFLYYCKMNDVSTSNYCGFN